LNGASHTRRLTASFRIRGIAALTAALLLAAPAVRAADLSALAEHQIKALYLFNFTRYVEWPADSFSTVGDPFTIAIFASPEISEDLREITRGKRVNGREILVQSFDEDGIAKGCQMIFVGDMDTSRVALVLHQAESAATLTVGEADDFATRGGIVNFVRRDNNVRLEINLDAARNARLVISAKLLAVAGIVRGGQLVPK